jgi:hypothetical protein
MEETVYHLPCQSRESPADTGFTVEECLQAQGALMETHTQCKAYLVQRV